MSNELSPIHVTDNIKKLMIENKISTTEMAKRTGIIRDTTRNIVEGTTRPNLKNLITIANTFEVSLDWLCSKHD